MNKITESARLYLREFERSDAQAMYDLNTDTDVVRYTGDRAFESVEEANDFLVQYEQVYKSQGFGRWAVVLKESNEFIGWCGLKQHEEYIDLGYRYFQKDWGKGYATEAAQATIEYAFNDLDLKVLVGRVAPQNIGSIKVLEKLNMQFWKKAPCGDFDDSHYYRIEKQDYIDQKSY